MKNKFTIATTFFLIGFLFEMVVIGRHYPYSVFILILECIAGLFIMIDDKSKPTKHL